MAAEQYGLEVADFEREFIAGGERFPGSPGDDVLVSLKIQLDNQLSRRNCHTFSTGFSRPLNNA
ncbi:hypothetical protein [Rhizobium laguerreae]|uniref:hypothetical protein n=1 Tax=Rhizobium laguerreae TaxID=1076926 RepID=UPI001FEE864E|nr:hypothetical protein [Rhizobium laguerreae]